MVLVHRDLPPLNSLIAFEAVAQQRSFTAAARRLGVTQAAVSQHVKSLEERLGVVLLRRERPQLRLTQEGELLAEAITASVERIGEAVRAIEQRRRGKRLTVATTIAFSAFWLMPRLPGFHARHSDVELRLVTSDSPIDWQGESVDLGISFTKAPPPGFSSDPLFSDEILAVAGPALHKAIAPITPAGLRQKELLHLDWPDQTWMSWQEWLARLDVEAKSTAVKLRFNNYMLLIQAALEGQGIALGWRRLVDPLLRRGDLNMVCPARVVPEARYHLLTPLRFRDDRAVLAFRHWLLQEAGADW